MARLDIYPLLGTSRPGYLLDVQADLLTHLASRAVVLLLPADNAPQPIRDQNPAFDIDGATFVMITQATASIPARELRRPVASLVREHDRITRAPDVLLVGFWDASGQIS